MQYIIASDVIDGGQRGEFSPGKLNVKNGPPLNLAYILVSIFFWFSVDCVFVFFGLFCGDLRF